MRGLASGAAATANWLANAIVSQTFLVLTQHLGGSGTFWIYTAVSLGGLLWVFHVLPETNGGPSMTDSGARLTPKAHQMASGQADLSWAVSKGDAAVTVSVRHQALDEGISGQGGKPLSSLRNEGQLGYQMCSCQLSLQLLVPASSPDSRSGHLGLQRELPLPARQTL